MSPVFFSISWNQGEILQMSSPSIDDLKREAQEVFGQALSDEKLEIYKGRLPTMLENVRLLAAWGKRLDQAQPAQIQCPVEVEAAGKDNADG